MSGELCAIEKSISCHSISLQTTLRFHLFQKMERRKPKVGSPKLYYTKTATSEKGASGFTCLVDFLRFGSRNTFETNGQYYTYIGHIGVIMAFSLDHFLLMISQKNNDGLFLLHSTNDYMI